jgi:hypothetical protein
LRRTGLSKNPLKKQPLTISVLPFKVNSVRAATALPQRPKDQLVADFFEAIFSHQPQIQTNAANIFIAYIKSVSRRHGGVQDTAAL